MGRPYWATGEQGDWLIQQAESYLKVKGTKETSNFWPPFFEEWKTLWPTPPLDTIISDGPKKKSTRKNASGSNNAAGTEKVKETKPQTLHMVSGLSSPKI